MPGRKKYPPQGRVDVSRTPLHPLLSRVDIDRVAREGAVDEQVLSDATSQYKARAMVVARSIIAQSPDTILDVVDILENPSAVGDLVSFTLQQGDVGYIDQIGIHYSDPYIASCISVGWRVIIDSGEPPNVKSGTLEFRYSSYGDVMEAMKIEPLWFQSEQTVRLQINPLSDKVNTFDNHLTMVGRLSGKIYHPSNIQTLLVT